MRIQSREPTFHSGQSVSTSGHYETTHNAHALRTDIALLKGNYFPACASCKAPVHFRLTQRLRIESAQERFRLLCEDGRPMAPSHL
jgi:hypothetical protein